MSKISIIIPVYNAERWLGECLDSVARQSFADWEAIVVDDGSTDSSAAIASRYADADTRFRLISRHNGGVSRARNAGLDEASGEWITYMDADDRLHPDALGSLLAVAADTDADVVIGRTIFLPEYRFGPLTARKPEVIEGDEAAARFLYQRGMVNGIWATLYRGTLKQYLQFRDDIRYEDLLMGGELLPHASRVALSPDVIYHYRDHDDGFMNQWCPEHADVLTVTDELCSRFMGNDRLARAARSRRFAAAYNIFVRASLHGDKDIADRCWSIITTLRSAELCDGNARMKNRVGALVSYTGRHVNRLIALWAGK